MSSLHFALDTRIFYKYSISLSSKYQVTVVGLHPKKEVVRGINIVPFPEYHNRLLRLFTSWLLMFFIALKQKASVYHIHDPELLLCAFLLKLLGKKVIVDVHENIADDIFDKEWIRFKRVTYYIFNAIEKFICRNTPVVLAEESYLKRYVNIAKDITIIHNYVEVDFFNSFKSENRNPLKLFYMGIVLESRCLSEIITSMQLLHDKGIKVEFVCVGKLYKRIDKLIKSHSSYNTLKEYLHFADRKSLEEGYELSKDCGIGICLIKPMKNSIESKPTKLFEYMACGLPIITSNFPLYKTLVEDTDTGITVNPLDSIDIANAILELINNKTLREKFISNGPITVNKLFNWDTEKSKLLKLYYNLIDK